MCGIFGYIGTKNIQLKKATDIITHRGPDSDGYLYYQPQNNELGKSAEYPSGFNVLFGFRRLAIIDLSHSADQPLSLKEQGYHIVFNGEIYNYIELRRELEKAGHTFKTNGDTEVLLRAYMHWGKDCLQRLNGMWAFAILNTNNNTLFCARDRFGVKPFYYTSNGRQLCFASEIKQIFTSGCLEKKINEKVLPDFLEKYITDHTEETFFENVYQLLPGHAMQVQFHAADESVKKEIYPYWKLEANAADAALSYEDARLKFKELFYDSVMLRFRSDVPVGSCLSGGLDSSSIVSVAADMFKQPIHAFTSQFHGTPYDESYYVNLVHEQYKQVEVHSCSLSEKILDEEIDKVIWHQDEPFTSFGIAAQWEVMKLARKNGVIVLLDGQGGDEQLAGYRKYYAFYLKELLQRKKLLSFASNFFHLMKNKEFNFFYAEGIYKYLGMQKRVDYLSARSKALAPSLNIGFSSANTVKAKSKDDIERFSFPPLLRYEDRNSMAHSIETRVPFMDYRLVQFLYSLPSDYFIRSGFTKALLRDSLKGVLPEQIRTRISKLGFSTPQDLWMEKSMNQYFKNYFARMDNPYLNNKEILADFEKFPKSKLLTGDFSRFYIFDKWMKINFS